MSDLEIAGVSRRGDRPTNQDRFGWWCDDHASFLVVGDGLGGHRGGELAAEALVAEAERAFWGGRWPLGNPLGFLRRLLIEVHESLLVAGLNEDPPITPMTTAALAVIQGGRVWWAALGDTRVYWLRGGGVVHPLSRDHSYAEELLERGLIQEPLPPDHPWRARLTRCLGGFPAAPPPHCGGPFTLAAGEALVLCSDGLWGPLSEQALSILAEAPDLEEAVAALAGEAVERAAPNADNTTLVVARPRSV